jgi:membrane-bound serine protease (ClpP class)
MTEVLVLFGAGVLLVAIDVVVPGTLLSVLGGICLVAGVVVAFREFGSNGGFIATGIAGLIGAATLYLEFSWLPKSRLARALSMAETNAGHSQPMVAERDAVVGRDAVAVTTLAPSGFVEVDGRRYEAFCQSGQVAAGVRLRVVDIAPFHLVVTQIKDLP